MGFRLPGIRKASLPTIQASSKAVNVPKGYLAVYVGDQMKRFMIPVSYLNQPLFQDLLSQTEEDFGYEHPMGGLTIQMKRFMIPVSYLNQPLFQDLLSQTEEDFGYEHPMGGLTIPCREDVFLDIISRLMRC